ncbi:MAG: hypothetical protein IBGAMO2_740016 [Arenicellales bacterium IbO2]|nr:MAG: hypothetical protein IBGAMO2_740016 [Arenicellales bacterium IbO2]
MGTGMGGARSSGFWGTSLYRFSPGRALATDRKIRAVGAPETAKIRADFPAAGWRGCWERAWGA